MACKSISSTEGNFKFIRYSNKKTYFSGRLHQFVNNGQSCNFKTFMKNTEQKLYSNLVEIAHKILQLKEKEEITALKKTAHLLYEKLAVLDFIRHQQFIFPNDETLQNETEAVEKFIKKSDVLQKKVVKTTETQKKINDEFEHTMPIEEGLKLFEGKTKAANTPEKKEPTHSIKKPLIKIDLNNRIGFVKHLFDDDLKSYMNLCEHLREVNGFEAAKNLAAKNFSKNSGEEKKEYIERFFNILENYCAKD